MNDHKINTPTLRLGQSGALPKVPKVKALSSQWRTKLGMGREYGVCYSPEPSISSLAMIPINVMSWVNKDLLDKYYGQPAGRPSSDK